MEKRVIGAVIAVIVIIGIVVGLTVLTVKKPPTPPLTPTPPKPPVTTPPVVTPTPSPPTSPTPPPATPAPVSCDMCHEREKTANLKAHTEGGLLVDDKPGCFNYWGCHGGPNATVHTVHPPEVTCVQCHGKIPKIPSKGPGGTTCENCHGYPNPLKSSEGNLVNIHLNRGKSCQVCHTGEISEIHGLK
ncbi:MAG: hypothetical protein ACXQTS_01490 [Candidatus Methanospirareceae archaeon]